MKSGFVSIALLLVASAALAQTPAPPLDAAASEPKVTGIMQGFPPPTDKTVRLADGSMWKFPQMRWAFSHFRELGPTADVWRGSGRPKALPRSERKDLDDVAFTTLDGKPMTWAEVREETVADILWHTRPGMTAHYSVAQVAELVEALNRITDERHRTNRSLAMIAREATADRKSPKLPMQRKSG